MKELEEILASGPASANVSVEQLVKQVLHTPSCSYRVPPSLPPFVAYDPHASKDAQAASWCT